MKNFVPVRQRTPSSLQTIFSAFVLSALALCSFFAVSGRAQQDDRGLVVKTETAKPPSPEEAKARAARPEIVLQTGYTIGGMAGMTFSPDGRLLATRVFNSTQVKLWDTRTGHELRTVTGSTGVGYLGMLGGVSALAFSPDGREGREALPQRLARPRVARRRAEGAGVRRARSRHPRRRR